MVDYTKPTGNAGTLTIRDTGSAIEFWLSCSDPATNSSLESWSGTVNGVSVGGNYSWSAGGGSKRIGGPWTVTSSQTVTFAIGATGTSGLGGPTSFSKAIDRGAPNAPSALTVTRNSDTQHTLVFTRNGEDYSSFVVQRRTNDGAWQTIATVLGTANSYVDSGTTGNRKYEWRIAKKNAGGQSGWSPVATAYTTPAAPSGVTAARSGANVVVSASGVPPYATSFDVMDGAAVVATSVALPYTHVSPSPSVTHTYKVRGKVGSLVGAWSAASNTVQMIAPPNPPTGLAPNGDVRESGDVTFTWVHNPVDSSPQSAYELRHRVSPSGAWSTLTGTTASSRTVSGIPAGARDWQVRTKGEHANFGDWSAVALFTAASKPGVAVTQPDGTWPASQLTVGWSWFQAEGRPQSAWQFELFDDGVLVESRTGSGAATSTVATTRLHEGSWTVRVRAATGSLWSEWAQETFTVVFTPPAAPLIGGVWDEDAGGAVLNVAPGVQGSFAATVNILVDRSVDGGASWTPVGETVDETILIDWECPSYGDTMYRATALTVEGAAAESLITVEARSEAVWLSGGPGFSVVARLPYDPGISVSVWRERTMKQYAGRSLPVAISGEGVGRTVALKGTLLDDDSATGDKHALTRLSQIPEPLFLYRDPDGYRIYGSIDAIQMSRGSAEWTADGWSAAWPYSVTLTEAT